jgi:hypothetical protein
MNSNINNDNLQIVNNYEKLNLLDELEMSMLLELEDNDDLLNKEIKINIMDSLSQKINLNKLQQYKDIFLINNNYNENIDENNPDSKYYPINKNIIKYLCYHLNDYDEKVRLASAISLGQISLPEGSICIKEIIKKSLWIKCSKK